MLEAQYQQLESRNDDESKYETFPHTSVSRLRDWMTSEKVNSGSGKDQKKNIVENP